MASSKTSSRGLVTTLSGLAQELDGPLQSMAQSTQKLIDAYKSRDFEYVSYKDFKNILITLEQINRQLRRCSSATGRMLALDGLTKKDMAGPCAINEVVREIAGLLKQQMAAVRVKVSLRLSKNALPVRLSNVECHQVVHNVLVNAIQAMPAGGVVRIRTVLDKVNKMAVLEVRDDGVGITPEHLPQIFEPFFTTKERGFEKNAGLGLSIVNAIVEKAGGGIHIKSSLRAGTVVRIDLPLAVPSKS